MHDSLDQQPIRAINPEEGSSDLSKTNNCLVEDLDFATTNVLAAPTGHSRQIASPNSEISTDFLQRFRGCILGGAVGDALGFATENLSHQRIREKYGFVADYKVRPGYGYFTDDTQLTMLLAEALIEDDESLVEQFRKRLARWRLVFPRLSGRATKDAALGCLLGKKQTGGNFPGSSPAMRSAPLGLFYFADEELLFAKTVESAKVTHTHTGAIGAALAVVFAVAYLIEQDSNEPLDIDRFLGKIAEPTGRIDPNLARDIESLQNMLSWEDERVLAELHKNSSIMRMPIRDLIMTSLYAFIKTPNNYKDSVLFCVNVGWDTDTMAAICGNISGAFNGVSAIPAHWLTNLENDYKGRDYLLRLADSLHQHTRLDGRPNPILDYLCDFAHNTFFLVQMFFFKPMV